MNGGVPRPSRVLHARRIAVVAALLVLLALLVFFAAAGRMLIKEDALEKADLIFVLGGTRVERWLEAVDLYKEGWAARIVLSPGAMDPAERLLPQLGVTFPREGELARDGAIALGVPPGAVSVLPASIDNTADEAEALRRTIAHEPVQRILVVTSGYHTRRARFAFRREFAETPVRILVRGSRYSTVQPARWWRSRSDVRQVVSELPKLAAYLAGLGR